MRLILFILFTSFCIVSCDRNKQPPAATREAWVPVYSQDTGIVKQITAGPVRSTVNAGKIYVLGNIIYQVEQDSGIHIINYSNPSSPQKVGFIRSFLCEELAVKNGLIYTNNGSDLVVIDATSINNVREMARTRGVFPNLSLQYPRKPANSSSLIYFECPDPSKGIVVRWEKKTVSNANCWR